MKKEKFIQLAQVKEKIKSLQDEEKKIQGEIIFEMKDEEVDSVRVKEMGLFTLVVRNTWQYTAETKEKVKEIYVKAQTDGGAEKCESESLRFTPKKEE